METKSSFLLGAVIFAVALAAIALGMTLTNGGGLKTSFHLERAIVNGGPSDMIARKAICQAACMTGTRCTPTTINKEYCLRDRDRVFRMKGMPICISNCLIRVVEPPAVGTR